LGTDRNSEQQKWNDYYSDLGDAAPPPAVAALGEELVQCISALLPGGGSVLEAGCGAGWQSLAIAETGRFDVALLDFSRPALEYAQRLFERQRLRARFRHEDAFALGRPEFDLVFSAGVLEHYEPEQQIAALRGMASRSRRFVLALVPNSLCYWYWLWRIESGARGRWPFGKEMPVPDMRALIEAAGLTFCGTAWFGARWTEDFINGVEGIAESAREQILQVHRSGLLPKPQNAYLVGALCTVDGERRVFPGWSETPAMESPEVARMASTLADALALSIASRQAVTEAEQRVNRLAAELGVETAAAILSSTVDADASSREAGWLEYSKMMSAERGSELSAGTLTAIAVSQRRQLERVSIRIAEYRARVQQELAVLRSQRAWKVMVYTRKLYSLLARGGVKGLFELLRSPGLSPADVAAYDISLPAIESYVPQSLLVQPTNTTDDMPEVPPATRYDVVILGIVDFDTRYQRPQQIAAEFAARGHRVFWMSPTRFLPINGPRAFEMMPLRERLWEIHLRGRQPDIYLGRLEAEEAAQLGESLKQVFQRFGIAEAVVMVQLPFWRQLALGMRQHFGSIVTYDCMDDWDTFQNMGPFNTSEEHPLAREADALFVTGKALADKFKARGLAPVLVRNGVDFDFFHQARPHSLPLPAVRPPIIGYYGAIADWMDLDLCLALAILRPQYNFVYIGQVFGRDTTKLERRPNVHLLGSRAYDDLPPYLMKFDACTIPFLLNEVTAATDPVKLYEYFSHGKPVVATDMAELATCADLLYIGSDAEDFARKLDAAVSENDPALRQRRIEFARANTWRQRVNDMDAEIRERFPLVSVLMVTYNSGEFVSYCLDSVREYTTWPNFEVVVVDNASTDNTRRAVERFASLDPRVVLHASDQNLGFAAANNVAAQKARGDHLILLNADTIVTRGWIERLIRPVKRDEKTGLVCAVTNFAGNEAKIAVDYGDFPEMQAFAARLARERAGEQLDIEVAPLFCGLIPRSVWEEVGGLDVSYEIGMFEDDDFSLRVRRAGYRVVTAEDCFIHHFGQGSFGKLSREQYQEIFERNRGRFERKWSVRWQAHRTRPGVRPPHEDMRFRPREFFQQALAARG
jgi:GT2 family glycosyltransferase/glycosyltransferase involved in cell wall biosynthesis/SAM-dependent methyltransferase